MALTNGYLPGFVDGRLYGGATKLACVPGLNCYSCPGAFFSCPIGALQAVLGSRTYRFSFYIVGFLLLIGASLGRAVCGFLCPFGFVQDLLHKIPFVKKIKRLPGEKALQALKYVVLAGFVVLLPSLVLDIVGQGSPWFCKYICPSGTLFAGIPLQLADSALREAAGGLFIWKLGLLIALLVLSVFLYRPFCRYLCPLGAIYGLFNPIALYRYRIREGACTQCGACKQACPMDIPTHQTPNHPSCIRCGACKRACPTQAILSGWKAGGCAHDPVKTGASAK